MRSDLASPSQEGANQTVTSYTQAQKLWGPNLEKLPDRLKSALLRLMQDYTLESLPARRREIQNSKRAHEFWKGMQYLWWSDRDQAFHAAFDSIPGDSNEADPEDQPRYEFVTNIYQAFGLSIIAVLSQDVPNVRFFPVSAESEEDMSTARAATKIAQLVERNNQINELLVQEGFFAFCDGKIGAYVRYVVDGQRFGFHPEDDYTQTAVQTAPGVESCAECDWNQEVSRGARPQPNCPWCGAATQTKPGRQLQIPVAQGQTPVANGQERITIVGSLQLKTPPWASEMSEYPYIQWNMEAHLARLRAAYPHAADKIGPPVAPDANAEYERMARLGLAQGGPLTEGGDYNQNLITFQRTWLAPWAFEILEDKALKQELRTIFPDGCYMAFAGQTYCESRNESMHDHWRVMHAMPGDGSVAPPAMGASLISVQERYNTLSNLQMETEEYGIPPTYVDPETLDVEALKDTTVEPGAHYNAKARTGQPLAASFFQPNPASVPPDVIENASNLMGPVAQFLTGAFPAIFGGQMQGSKTASEYSMARDQAMGRIGLVWRRMEIFHAEIMLLAVECFRKNRPGDVDVPVFGDSADFESEWIREAELKGNIVAYADAEQQYPANWAEQRATLMQLMASPEPQIQEFLSLPENQGKVKSLIGLENFTLPDEDARTKTLRAIAKLLKAQPSMAQDPQTGAPSVEPSIAPDPLTDNLAVAQETLFHWFSSDAGQSAQAANPNGWLNVRAYYVAVKGMNAPPLAAPSMPAPQRGGAKPPNLPSHPAPAAAPQLPQ